MKTLTIGLAGMLLLLAAQANAQSLPGRVTGAVGGVGSTVGGAAAGASGLGGAQASSGVGNLGGSMSGGDLPAGFGVKAGDKVIQFRGAVGVGDDRSNVRAGVGIPF
jgi:hypothetical protein